MTARTCRLHAVGCGLRLTRTGPHDGSVLTIPVGTRVLRLQQGGFPHYGATCLRGTLAWTGSSMAVNTFGHGKPPDIVQIVDVEPEGNETELALENHLNQWRPRDYPRSFEACVTDAETEFARWCAATPVAPDDWRTAWLTAAYTCWSALVEPRGLVRRRIMLSSKNIMHSIWSWDSFFFAQAHAASQPDLAWDLWAVVFDHMDQEGGAPNLFNDVQAMWGFVIIPVGGWIFRRMAEVNPAIATREHLREAARLLSSTTRWWFRFRDDDKRRHPGGASLQRRRRRQRHRFRHGRSRPYTGHLLLPRHADGQPCMDPTIAWACLKTPPIGVASPTDCSNG